MVPEVIAKFIELIENHQVLPGFPQFPAFVKNLFYIAFAAGSFDNFSGDRFEPLKALTAHALRQDGNAFASQQCGIIGPAAAVVAGGRPDGFLGAGIELAGHQPGNQTAECRPYLM